jgi:hypothetical protein
MEEKKINIRLTPEMTDGVYANLAIIAHSPSEFIIDFASLMPGSKDANVKSRVILTPENAKKLLFALQDNFAKYEQQYGTVKINGAPAQGSTYPVSFGGGEA